MRHKYLFLFLLFSFSTHSQNCLQHFITDSDAEFLSSDKIIQYSILRIEFIEPKDSLCFLNYPPLPSSVKYIKHLSLFNSDGLAEYYEWSFSDKSIIDKNEAESSFGRFFIVNENEIF